jgi:ubiquinone/menaquinone biosynthesis C-methylase UbiE
MSKQQISSILRKTGFLHLADKARYHQQKFINSKDNREFRRKNPTVKLPPDYLIYESHELNYEKYFNGGYKTAEWLVSHFEKHIHLKDRAILDWGCGPARIIRHLPDIVGNGCTFLGSDYNEKSIQWNSKNIQNVDFNLNSLKASLPYKNDFIDIIYALSVFTHLSEKLHYEWFDELYRILKPGGIMLITTSGKNYKGLLTMEELVDYEQHKLVARGQVKEGHRVYTTFHPEDFMRNLFKSVEILDHIVEKPQNGWLPQDIWIVRK